MAQDPRAALRSQLTFEQQSRFDALYARQSKSNGTATVLSMPLLGTFGAEQFYLGNVGQGIIRVLFSWTLIPTILALFEVFSGDIGRQVAHANDRIAKRVYKEVVANTPSSNTAPHDVRDSVITPSAIAEAAALAAEVPFAPQPAVIPVRITPVEAATVVETASTTDATPPASPSDVTVVDETQREEVAATTATFTVTESAAEWNKDMAAPAVTGDEQTMTFTNVTDTTTDTIVSDEVVMPSAEVVATESSPTAATENQADDTSAGSTDPTEANAYESISDSAEPLALDGVLIFVEDEEPFDATTDDDVAGLASVVDLDETSTDMYVSADVADGTAAAQIAATDHAPATVAFFDAEPLSETPASATTGDFVDVAPPTEVPATEDSFFVAAVTEEAAQSPAETSAAIMTQPEVATVDSQSEVTPDVAESMVVPGAVAAVGETPTETITAVTEQQTTEDVAQQRIIEADHEGYQHYHDGKLVSASRHDEKMVGEISSLLDDTTSTTLLSEIDHRAEPSGWLDAQPLHQQQAQPTTPAHAEVTAPPPYQPDASTPSSGNGSQSGTDMPGGGVGDAPTGDVPGGAIGDGGTTNTPDGGLGTSADGTTTPSTGDAETGTDAPKHPHPHDPASHSE